MSESKAKSVIPVLLDIPHGFEIDGRHFYLQPQTLGTMQITARLMEQMGINLGILVLNPTFETMRIAYTHREKAALLVAYNCTRGKREALDLQRVQEAATYMADHTTLEELALLLMLIIGDNRLRKLKGSLGIDKEQDMLKRAVSAKKNESSYTYGGISVYGGLIGAACEKYHMGFDEVVWDISYYNLQLMMSDASTTVFLSEEERKAANIPKPGAPTIKVCRENLDKIKEMFKEK